MATVLTDVQPFAQVHVHTPRRATTRKSACQCLVLSSDPKRGEMLEKPAADSGWSTTVCQDAEAAVVELRRNRHQLLILDLEGDGEGAPLGFREMVERQSGGSGPLVMICGHEGDVLEEIWARQYGAWLYLPGVDATCDISMLCSEAKRAAEKLHPELADDRFATSELANSA